MKYKFLSKTEIGFHKDQWTIYDLDILECMLETKPDEKGVVRIDIRRMIKRAMFEFIKISFPSVARNKKHPFWKELGDAYKESYDNFYNKLYVPTKSNPPLWQHQLDCLMPMVCKKDIFLALEMGTGKTLTSIYLSKTLNIKKTIIICPAAVKWNWLQDLTRGFGFDEFQFTILDASKTKTIRAYNEKYIIINYEMLDRYFDYLTRHDIGHIICDEVQKIKNIQTIGFKAVTKIRKHFPKAHLTLLSGTPIKNRIDDLYAYLKLMGHKLGKNKSLFLKEYTTSKETRFGKKITGAKNIDQLYAKMSNHFIRLKSSECQDLPDLIINKYYFELNDYQEEYDKAISDIVENKSENFDIQASVHTLNIIVAKSKIKGVIELAKELLANDRKVVIFASYTEPLKLLHEAFKKISVYIDGSVNAYERSVRINKFRDEKDCTVFLGNMVAAGVGINLNNANDCIMLNFPMSPADLEQAQKRCVFGGQKVYTTKGYLNIEDIQIGDKVYTHNGNFRVVYYKHYKI